MKNIKNAESPKKKILQNKDIVTQTLSCEQI